MPLDEEQANSAEEMARSGRTISEIQRALKTSYEDIWTYLTSIGAYSWLGSKRIITRRLRDMVRSPDQSRRQTLADEANEMIDYLYYEGRQQGALLNKIRKVLD